MEKIPGICHHGRRAGLAADLRVAAAATIRRANPGAKLSGVKPAEDQLLERRGQLRRLSKRADQRFQAANPDIRSSW